MTHGIVTGDVPEAFVPLERRAALICDDALNTLFEARFWRKVCVEVGDHCWQWTAGTGAGGYGMFKLRPGATIQAHRYALIRYSRRDPEGLEAAHSCGNVLCCNPQHLRWATRAENEADKGRTKAEIARLTEVSE